MMEEVNPPASFFLYFFKYTKDLLLLSPYRETLGSDSERPQSNAGNASNEEASEGNIR